MRSLALPLLWVAASAGTISVAWAGVAVVDSEVIAPAPATVAPIVIDETLIDETLIGDTGDTGDSAVSDDTAGEETTSDDAVGDGTAVAPPVAVSADVTTTSMTPTTTTVATDGSGDIASSTSTTSTTVPTTTTTTTTSTTTTAPPVAAQTLTFTLLGGTTSISFSPTGIDVLWATPNDGFDVKVEAESPGLKVEFRSEDHRSRIDAWWEDGPAHDIEERSE